MHVQHLSICIDLTHRQYGYRYVTDLHRPLLCAGLDHGRPAHCELLLAEITITFRRKPNVSKVRQFVAGNYFDDHLQPGLPTAAIDGVMP